MLPGDTPRTRPVLLTTATAGLADVHVTVRPVMALPAESRTTTVMSCDSLTFTTAALRLSCTAATAVPRTVTSASPRRPSACANSAPLPGATARTRPSVDTVNTAGAPESHRIVRPLSSRPAASSGVACTRPDCPARRSTRAGVTRTCATGDGDTVTVIEPVRPSLRTVMTAVPGDTAVTVPSDATRARAASLLAYVMGRPVSNVPVESVTWTASRTDSPTANALRDGEMMMAPTGSGRTSTSAVPERPPFDAVIVVVPGDTPSTNPDELTVATDPLATLHAITRSSRTLPAVSRTTALSGADCPTDSTVRVGESCTVAVGTGRTVSPMVVSRDSEMAVMVTTPGVMPVTTPAISTTAIRSSLDRQLTTRPSNGEPRSSRTVACSVRVPVTRTVARAAVISTRPTARRVTVTEAVALFPSADTAMRAFPERTACTCPSDVTRATVESLLDHVSGRDESGCPSSSNSSARSAAASPSASVSTPGTSETVPTGSVSGVGVVISLSPAHAVVASMPTMPTTPTHRAPSGHRRARTRLAATRISAPGRSRAWGAGGDCGFHRQVAPRR